MSNKNTLEDIEKAWPVESIEVDNIQVWPFLKIYFGNLLISGLGSVDINTSVFKSFFKSFTYGFFNLFRKYDYLVFSSSDQRKLIEGQYYDKSVDYICERLSKSLVFELPVPKHFPKDKIPTKYIVSKYLLYVLILFRSKLFFKSLAIKNEQLIKDILSLHNIKLDYRSLIKRHLAQYKIMSFLISIYKPKAVFIVCPYTQLGFVKALKDRGIKVIEIQHGLINKNHLGYNISKKVDANFYPDYLLTFGTREKDVFSEGNHFIQKENVLTSGHLYIDYISSEYKGDNKFKQLIGGYKKAVAIAADGVAAIDNKTIDFLNKAAELDRDIIYIYIPRYKLDKQEFIFTDNIKIVDWLNVYEIISQCNFHSTVYSTCAIEAPSLGVQNILINTDNLSQAHYGLVLNNTQITRIVNTPEEYVHEINNFKLQEKEFIINSNKEIITPGYKKNIDAILNQILNK